jgi:predicted Zn-dependent protease
MFQKHMAVRGLAGFALVLAACAIDPVSGRPEAVLTSEAGEIEQGRDAAKTVEEQLGLVESQRLSTYLNAIGQRLVRHSPRAHLEHHFYLVDMTAPNAFALPGGHVYVSRGLLSLVNSEDELANVIGHEIGHVAARHSVERQVRSVPFIPVKIAAGIGGLAVGMVAPRLGRVVEGVAQLPGAFALATYSRSQEREADRIGQKLAAAAGWDPAAMGTFMDTLAREEALAGQDPTRTSFFASHPSSPERAAETGAFAKTLERAKPDPVAATQAEFLGRLAGLVVGEPAAGGVFVDNRFLHPDLGFALAFPDGWETQNTRSLVAARDPDETGFAVLKIVDEGDDPVTAANAFAGEHGLTEGPRSLRIGGLPAARGVSTTGRPLTGGSLHLTWVAHRGRVYLVAGICPKERFSANRPLFEAMGGSFHPLTPAERAEVRESRLRIVEARQGETLRQLLERAGGSWTPEEAAVANGLEVNTSLRRGALIKIAVPEPYTPAR